MKKKGVSIMIGYVILIVIAISLAIMVYAYLKLYLPKDQPECERDVFITIDELSCSGGELYLELSNRGLFNSDGIYVRIGDQGRIFKETISEQHNNRFGSQSLSPGGTWNFTYRNIPEGEKEIEIQPFVITDEEPVLCENSVISREVSCSSTGL